MSNYSWHTMIRSFRSFFWIALLMIFSPACQSQKEEKIHVKTATPSAVTFINQQEYAIHQRLILINEGPGQPEKQNIWVALIQDMPPYQDVLSFEITPKDYTPVTDEYGNRYAEFDFSQHPAGTTKIIDINYRIAVNELGYDLSNCEGELLNEFTQPEQHIESANPQIMDLAGNLAQGKSNACKQVRAFYDYIGNKLVYSPNNQDWGAQATLGLMGADCTEYAALMVALSRAQGIPARYFEGLLYLDEETATSARSEHAWADVYLPVIGWVAIDPTLGRSSIHREEYFAHYTPEHIIVTLGSNPSTLRGSSYWTHLYWPGDSTKIRVEAGEWEIVPLE